MEILGEYPLPCYALPFTTLCFPLFILVEAHFSILNTLFPYIGSPMDLNLASGAMLIVNVCTQMWAGTTTSVHRKDLEFLCKS